MNLAWETLPVKAAAGRLSHLCLCAVTGAGVPCDQAPAQNLTPHLHGTEPGSLFILFPRKSCFWWQVRPWPFQGQVVFLSPNPSFFGSFFPLLGGCLCSSFPTPGDPGYCPQPGSRMRREVWLLSPVPVGLECEREFASGGELRMGAQERVGGSASSPNTAQPPDLAHVPALAAGPPGPLL